MPDFIDDKKGVVLSQDDIASMKNFMDVASRLEKGGFVVPQGTVAFCPLAWLAAEVVVATLHYAYEESYLGGDVAAMAKAYEQNAVKIKSQMTKLQTAGKKTGVQMLSELKNNIK